MTNSRAEPEKSSGIDDADLADLKLLLKLAWPVVQQCAQEMKPRGRGQYVVAASRRRHRAGVITRRAACDASRTPAIATAQHDNLIGRHARCPIADHQKILKPSRRAGEISRFVEWARGQARNCEEDQA